MKIKITLLALLLGLSFTSFAQIYKEDYNVQIGTVPNIKTNSMIYGIMAGVYAPVMSDKQDIVDISNTAGYQFGMMWGLDFGALEIVPEIWFQHNKSDITHTKNQQEGYLKSNDIEVPIIFSMNFANWVRLNCGPSFALMSNTKYYEVDSDDVLDFGPTKSTVGYVVGVSFLLSERFILDARYTGRFVSVDSDWYSGSSEHEYRYYNYSFNIGYIF